jgi:hypothetical protein
MGPLQETIGKHLTERLIPGNQLITKHGFHDTEIENCKHLIKQTVTLEL